MSPDCSAAALVAPLPRPHVPLSVSCSIQWRKPRQASPGALVLTRPPWTSCTLSCPGTAFAVGPSRPPQTLAIFKRRPARSEPGTQSLWLPRRAVLSLSAGPLPRKAKVMCNRFVGTWKLVSSENFDDYMKELGEKCSFLFCFVFVLISFLWECLFFILCFGHGWCLLPGHKSTLITFLA